MDDLFIVVVGAIAGGVGFLAHVLLGRLKRETPEESQPAPPAEEDNPSHEHDWHIKGKEKGVVIQYCLTCRAERPRPGG